MSFELIAGKRSRSPSPLGSSESSFCIKTGGDTDSEEDQSDESGSYVPKDDVSFKASADVDVLEVAECGDDCDIFSIFDNDTSLGVALTRPSDRSPGRTTRDKAAGGGTASAIFYGKTREGEHDVVVKVAQICDTEDKPVESCEERHPDPTAFDLEIKRWHTTKEFLNEARVHDVAAAEGIHPKIYKKMILKVNEDVYGVTVMQRLGRTLHSRLKKLGMLHESRDSEALQELSRKVYNLLERTVKEARVVHEDLHTGNVLFGADDKLQLIDFGKQAREISDYEESDVEKHVSSMVKIMIKLDLSHCYGDSKTQAEVRKFLDDDEGKKKAKEMLQILFTKCCLVENPEWMV